MLPENVWCLLGQFEKCHYLTQTGSGYFLGNIWKNTTVGHTVPIWSMFIQCIQTNMKELNFTNYIRGTLALVSCPVNKFLLTCVQSYERSTIIIYNSRVKMNGKWKSRILESKSIKILTK